ncbi:MAG: elongation factor 4, partial [Candidatus Aureabacteria bacterium]|nr:elongation factor 4 [Candidatus Auribacterota bacterium]
MIPIKQIRNFSIIAHIDHGKSTLADRFLQYCKAVEERVMKDQILDDMDLERERGITIKAHAVNLEYLSEKGGKFYLNLIDTPGHVDFSYEVSRSLAACEGVLLLVDATQGIQAQTLANMHLARQNGLAIIGVINKIDMPNADVRSCEEEMRSRLDIPEEMIYRVSAKTGEGVPALFEAIIRYIPCPETRIKGHKLKALIFDSIFDNYKGVILYLRIVSGRLQVGDQIYLMHGKKAYEILELGFMTPSFIKNRSLDTGMVGYVMANIRRPEDVSVGDTVTLENDKAAHPLHGFKPSTPMVFSGMYPVDPADYEELKKSFEKLKLNDSSLVYEPETSVALGFGFRVGFLGLLHMEIIQERIDREYGIGIIMTIPSVIYKVMNVKGEIFNVDNPSLFPSPEQIEGIDEPYVRAHIMIPSSCMGAIMRLCTDKRGELYETETLGMDRVVMTYLLPLAEILTDFYDKLKSITQGYGSIEYEEAGYHPTDVVKMDILLNGEPVDAFSTIVHRSKAESVGRSLILKLKEVIPRHLFAIPIQAAIGSKIIARETISALRKNVTAKCYGGDIT